MVHRLGLTWFQQQQQQRIINTALSIDGAFLFITFIARANRRVYLFVCVCVLRGRQFTISRTVDSQTHTLSYFFFICSIHLLLRCPLVYFARIYIEEAFAFAILLSVDVVLCIAFFFLSLS